MTRLKQNLLTIRKVSISSAASLSRAGRKELVAMLLETLGRRQGVGWRLLPCYKCGEESACRDLVTNSTRCFSGDSGS